MEIMDKTSSPNTFIQASRTQDDYHHNDYGMKDRNATTASTIVYSSSYGSTSDYTQQPPSKPHHNVLDATVDTSTISAKTFDSNSADIRLNFRRSHTCGSLFAKCGCSTPSPYSTLILDDSKNTTSDDHLIYNNGNQHQSVPSTETESALKTLIAKQEHHYQTDNEKRSSKSSYSHPDTAFIFTDENKNAIKDSTIIKNGRSSTITTKGGKLQLRNTQRLSTPNIGNYAILDVAVHPEVFLTISTTKTDRQHHLKSSLSADSGSYKRPLLQRSQEYYKSSDSENSIEILHDTRGSPPSTASTPTPPPLVHSFRSASFSETKNPYSSSHDSQSDCDELLDDLDAATIVSDRNNWEYLKYTAIGNQQLSVSPSVSDNPNAVDPAQKYFQESGILGPLANNSVSLIRKTSKIMQDSNFIEHIRKNSKLLRQGGIHKDELEYTRTLIPNVKVDVGEKAEDKVKLLEDEVDHLRDIIKTRDSEIYKLKREIHKLKSVLQQTTNQMQIGPDELLSTLQTHHGMAGQQHHQQTPSPSSGLQKSVNHSNSSNLSEQIMHQSMDTVCTSNNNGPVITNTKPNYNCKQPAGRSDSNIDSIQCAIGGSSGLPLKSNQAIPPQHAAVKKQGVSGESSDSANQQSNNVPIPKFKKDFRSKQLIKDAIMDNDFLKNIDSTQVRELVESMYSLDVAKGEYVIREGDAGAHLYVSAEGDFEVMKNGKVLGLMGPGKAFGELAILYNCTRTASIRVVSNARVWVLDRRVFQQIMMRTGMQRIEENVNFLKSVPLLKNLSNDVLAKIADVLEVEFYPAGTYIIRQGASGDTFFLISQGTVKVTQRLLANTEEKEIRTLNRGDYFGEQALINEDKRTANIIAMPPGVECLTLDRESFTHLIGDLCELKEKNYGDESRVLAMKFAETNTEIFGANLKQELQDVELNDLELVATLGIGGFGRVELVKCYHDNRVETFALKCLKKKHILDTRQEEHVFSERTIMLFCNTPFICRLYRTFRDEKYVYMLLEACMGGEVWTILRDRGCFDETTAQFIIGCVLQAFEYLHSRGIIYRDLKPENLMLDERGYVKLVDFGFAKYIGQSSKTWTFCGTPEYVAPEIILNKGHDRAVDYWALGILIHELLNGTPPFTANDPMKTYNIILKGIDMVDFPKHMTRSAIMLIKRLCRDVPAERLGYQKGGIQDIKKHKWFQGFDWDGLSDLTLIPPFLRPVSNSLDTSYFDSFPPDMDVPPDEVSGWDEDF